MGTNRLESPQTADRLPTREHHVAGMPPAWARPSQAFRHFDGSLADDWRHTKPVPAARHAAGPSRIDRLRQRAQRLGRIVAHYFAPTPKQRLVLGSFMLGMAWGVMCAIGMLAAWGIHP